MAGVKSRSFKFRILNRLILCLYFIGIACYLLMFSKDSATAAGEEASLTQNEFGDVLPGLNETLKTITVSNDDFGFWVFEISNNPQKYVGYKIRLTGFVSTGPALCHEEEFMASRMLMTCCAADVTPLGLICKYDRTAQLKAGSWVTVEGILFSSEQEFNRQSYENPEIEVTKLIPANEVSGYVYAY
ncbi:TIGR03943 family putative permease subunit [Lacrimispora sp. JR3]|uniref:TIGR03943 family putative permease subunit n=1 Tax=Lacrimispora sinapis TaxID=3111456 RepID=UPI0037484B77